jgi:hypothetical protein
MKTAHNLQPFYTSIFLFCEDRIRVQKNPMKVQGIFWFTDSFGENMALILIYKPKGKLLISVGKYYIFGRKGS